MNRVIVNQQNGKKYSLLQQVGQGAYAKVYKGLDLATNEFVAIKKMKRLTEADQKMAQKEIQLMKTFNHKNIVKLIDDFSLNGTWYIVLEYCGKGDLQKLKERIGRMPQHHCRAIIRAILEALNEIHTQKIIKVDIKGQKKQLKRKIAHRDLKLANILVNDRMQLKLADFGFSKDFESEFITSYCGTPLTMAPEVLKKEKYNEKCDIWSLGVIAYFLIYDKYPFFPNKEDGPGLVGLTNAVTFRKLEFDAGVPVSTNGIDFMEKCLQKSIKNRPLSHELLKHPWLSNMTGTLNPDNKQFLLKGIEPEQFALKKLKGMLFAVTLQHIKKIYDGLLLQTKSVVTTIAELVKYYSNNKNILGHYIQLVQSKLNELRSRQILLSYEEQITSNILKKQFKIKLTDINRYHQLEKEVKKIISPLDAKSQQEDNPAQELVMFLIEETEKLMDSFNQEEVDSKLKLFNAMAKFITVDFDETLICVRWGERDELAQLCIYVREAFEKFDNPKILEFINEEQTKEDDLESTWMIEHYIAQSPNRNTNEHELGRLLLSILKIPSNFNIETGMKTEKIENRNIDLEDDQNYGGLLLS